MRYIIMCGGQYDALQTPKQLIELDGERIVERTIRLLKECGVDDIAISTNNPAFKSIRNKLRIPLLAHENKYHADSNENVVDGLWVDAFYPQFNPVCYIMGDVLFSKYAIETIVNTETDSVEFFASAPPFHPDYPKKWAEPFAFKVVDTYHFFDAVDRTRKLWEEGAFKRRPISWELWQVIKDTPLNKIDYTNYTVINDWTSDIDCVDDAIRWKNLIEVYGFDLEA